MQLIRIRFFRPVSTALCLIILIVLFTTPLHSQNKSLAYAILQKGTEIGSLRFVHEVSGERMVLRLESAVQPKAFFAPVVTASEHSIYENEILTYSAICRNYNDKEKLNKKTRLQGERYLVQQGDASEVLSFFPIRNNMLCMYAREPNDVSQVYSEIFQEFLAVKRIGDQHYRIQFPDGNYNEYFYQYDICTKIKVHHTLFNITIELRTPLEALKHKATTS